MKHVYYFLKQIHLYAGKKLYFNLLGMVFISLLEGIGIILLLPMINMSGVVKTDTVKLPFLEILDPLQRLPAAAGLSLILCFYILIVIGQNLLHRHITIQNAIIQLGFFRYLRVETYNALLHSNWEFFIRNRKSDLINLLTTEIGRASSGTHYFLQFTTSLIFTFIQIALAFYLSTSITLLVLFFGLVLIFLNRKFLRSSHELGKKTVEIGKKHIAGISDHINGIKEIKSNSLEESRMVWYRSVTRQMQIEQVEHTKLRTKSQLYYHVASAILIASFIFIAVKSFQAEAGQLMLIIVIFSRLWPRASSIQASMEKIASTLPSFKAIIALQNECKKAKEIEQAEHTFEPIYMNSGIDFSNIHFRYSMDNPTYALKDINVFIPSNQTTAIIGRSGAGKSTFVDVLMGLNTPEKGQILIDGVPLEKANILSWRKSISYVPQDPFLFNASVRENLLFGEESISDTQLWNALEISSAAEFVKKLPQGLDTLMGDRGIKLSGGERQRIVLARALIRKPRILILDEATSALDTYNESIIQGTLNRLNGKMTIIVIAHRLSTIRNANQVIVLEQGKVIQQGGYRQLAKEKQGMFSNLLASQWEASL